ncbi:MAG TPA: SDR family NAD(P)-dependent oxidoreductase [Solirubrobacterales bacterium]|nr:SDR family NAD(P)-dependent oxidoreductase [Solirubrobacterales bacterium]
MSRTIVVTGAARGIGAATARHFLAAGDRVFGFDLDRPDEAEDGVRYLTVDVSDPESVAAAFAEVGELDVLISNAGVQGVGLVGEQPREDWLRVVETNLHGSYFCASEAVGRLREGGAIVFVASAAAYLGLPGRSSYCAAKAGILALARVLAVELAPRGLRANAVCPGYVRTELVDKGIEEGWLRPDWMMERVPMDRFGRVEEVVAAIAYLAGPDAGYVTGASLVIDGGWTVNGIGGKPDWLEHE